MIELCIYKIIISFECYYIVVSYIGNRVHVSEISRTGLFVREKAQLRRTDIIARRRAHSCARNLISTTTRQRRPTVRQDPTRFTCRQLRKNRRGAPLSPSSPARAGAVRFAYTLIQPWSLGRVCKCDAIFRPVSRMYNTFGLENPLRGPGPRRCASRACYVRVYARRRRRRCGDGQAEIRTRAYVRCNCRTRQTGYPSAPQHQHQPPGHRLQHQTGSLHAFGREHHILRARVPSPFLLHRSSPPPFSSPPQLVPLSFSLSLYLSLALPATSALTSLRQTQVYARTLNRAYCRGYTPIDPEVPSNGQLENRLGFPRSHPARPRHPFCSLAGRTDGRLSRAF